jgi:hypothetical protein
MGSRDRYGVVRRRGLADGDSVTPLEIAVRLRRNGVNEGMLVVEMTVGRGLRHSGAPTGLSH